MDNTNLPTTQNNSLNRNPISVLKNLNAFTKIKEFDKVGHLVIPVCNKHAVLSGIDKEIDPFTKEEIAKYTAVHLKNLTFEEIEIAFQNERFNLYDKKSIHYNFFSIDYYVEVIKKYIAWKQNQMTINNIPINQIHLQDNANSITENDKKAIRVEFIINIFNELKHTKKEYINDAFTLYEDFVEHKLISVDLKQKQQLYSVMNKEAKKEAAEQLSKAYNSTIKKQLQIYIQKLTTTNKDALVANKCKSYLVCKSIASHQTVEDVLKKINLEK